MVQHHNPINNEDNWMEISEKAVLRVFIYYCFVLVAGLIGSTWAIYVNHCAEDRSEKIVVAIVGSLSMAAVGSAIFYIRKLYKALIQGKISKIVKNKLRSIGTIIYLIIRPIFSLGFSILVVVGVNAGMLSMVDQNIELNEGFVNVCMFISFFCGFSSGNFIKSLEKRGTSLIPSLLQDTKTELKEDKHGRNGE